ncbi:rhodanese-like domain-containing protein [Listeria cossartiae]|uniref:Rhodanese-like domain-containing protein n=1 Tax=Listeria swaminathanii TaxID=2713501 RepID=A0ABU2IDM0_9LIST|nr:MULTISPECIES: rhodanese-like domain-containing protein [Listeria]MCD2224790.1 rhodanese-like domain-containing protein [Listeria cossartiae]MCD2239150.1 rhodanese-like domain-containing protein [Listeria cossartiae]MDT0015922.1 rhodanese-like domain-containing protein [Listeria swaminathanii]MDT0021358.1 rhodanese-like domain-containing protein [Listeria swaminathanii]MDT0032322.1 rhodanese-like domain-containing protein [Listeria swaminathanii]
MYQSITANDLEQELKNSQLNILDVRDADAFVEGHIPDAINIPINELPEKLATLDKEQAYTIICYAGGRSERASQFLAAEGFDVTNVMGGMGAFHGSVTQ